jgi:hypothetical protein
MKRLRVTAGASGLDRAARGVLQERLGNLRPRAVAGAQKQDSSLAASRAPRFLTRTHGRKLEAGMQRGAQTRQQLVTAVEIKRVVRIATVCCATAPVRDPTAAQARKVVGDQVLRQLKTSAKLSHAPVAVRQLSE